MVRSVPGGTTMNQRSSGFPRQAGELCLGPGPQGPPSGLAGRGDNIFFIFLPVKLLMDLPEALICHVCVNLRRSDAGMAEHFLDTAEIGAVIK